MWTFIKKDMLIYIRDRSELLLILGMPILLIAILGFALGGVFGGNTEAVDVQAALVDLDDRSLPDGLEELPEAQEAALRDAAEEIDPAGAFHTFLENDDVRDVLTVTEMDADEAEEALQSGEVDAVLTLPEAFTENVLEHLLLDEGDGAAVELTLREEGSVYAGIAGDLIHGFTERFTLEAAAAQEGGAPPGEEPELGGQVTAAFEPVSSIEYYAVGMAVMFCLYVAGTTASKAHVEKQQHVYSRILLAGRPSVMYLGGKLVSGWILSGVQLLLLFAAAAVLFQAFDAWTVRFWLGTLLVTAALSFAVGALGSLITAITIRSQTETAATVFAGGIVTLAAFVGGSFFAVDQMGIVPLIGQWTPNGAAMTAYLQWSQGFSVSYLLPAVCKLIGMGLVFFTAAVLLFPSREGGSR
ncbi:ABC transporter permease [Alkalicoccus urumqiensis]|uniref:ABC transporter permease n=1 Tax=Alkalicoccus urumqiensis TaxID=1548213 RepID=A0A2P6MJV1_ALKUR|nr:ABC transporter permease [Alkalicoccus urumqiensis]PRO66557.1 ABC transporter permease [Alkalicoccus urumqiensis]